MSGGIERDLYPILATCLGGSLMSQVLSHLLASGSSPLTKAWFGGVIALVVVSVALCVKLRAIPARDWAPLAIAWLIGAAMGVTR